MTEKKIKFKAELLPERKTAIGIRVPKDIIEQLGNGKRPPVKATINGYTYSSTSRYVEFRRAPGINK